jgi:LuxR family maltose regulon positive regulatory protein
MAMKPESSGSPLSGEQLARTLLFAKLAPPVLRGDVIGRARLLQPMEQTVRAKLLLIHAPAGYGKTTLMVQWFKQLKEAGEGVGWINLDERDNDPVTLLAGLQLALLPDTEQETLDALTVINRCAGNHARFTLFLDELEAVHAPQAMQLLELLVDYSPKNLHVVVGTRTTPALPLARLRIRHELFELNSEHLRFLRAEAAQLLYVRGGAELSGAAWMICWRRLKAGPQPCSWQRLRSRAASIKTTSWQHLSGSRSRSSSIWQSTSWASCPMGSAHFCWQTSGLQRLCASLCDAVTGRSDSATMLGKLESANLFLQPLDETREWYRYHALFAEFLQLQLRAAAPGQEIDFARRASDWCAGKWAHGGGGRIQLERP